MFSPASTGLFEGRLPKSLHTSSISSRKLIGWGVFHQMKILSLEAREDFTFKILAVLAIKAFVFGVTRTTDLFPFYSNMLSMRLIINASPQKDISHCLTVQKERITINVHNTWLKFVFLLGSQCPQVIKYGVQLFSPRTSSQFNGLSAATSGDKPAFTSQRPSQCSELMYRAQSSLLAHV